MQLAMLNYEPAKRRAAMSGLGACGPCSRISPLSGLGVIDFGGGVDSYGRQRVMAPLVPTSTWMISAVDGMAERQSVPTLMTRLSQHVAAWETANPEQVVSSIPGQDSESPASAQVALSAMAADHCHMYPDTCVGVDVAGTVAGLIAQYTQWWNSAVANYYDMVASGAMAPQATVRYSPPAGYVPYNQVSGASAPDPSGAINTMAPAPNVLNAVTPQAQNWFQAPTASVLAPPQAQPPVPISSIQQTFTGSQALVTGVNEGGGAQQGTSSSDWLQKNWMLLAVAAGALFLLGGRR